MKVNNLLNIDSITLLTNDLDLDSDIKNYYCGDLLSFVLANATEEDTCLITINPSMNVIGIAVLLEFKAVIFTSDIKPSSDVIKKAIDENIPLFQTKLHALDVYKEILKYENKI